ncbi:kinase-like domain-containing protein [Xylaria curta]|nr:kinase-like domain-containing protein [Xylaria curta]
MDQVFATLTPANAPAKIAFSEVFDTDCQGAPTNAAAHRTRVEAEQQYDADVLRFRRAMDHRSNEGDSSESLTELNSETELDIKHLGMVRKGCYILSLKHGPLAPDMGWTVGKRSVGGGTSADFILCTTRFAKRHSPNLRSSHARFGFDRENGAFFIASLTRSPFAETTVNTTEVSRQRYALNQHSMRIQVDSLAYEFRYTDFASTEDFVERRKEYLVTNLKASPYRIFDMPTPYRVKRTIGQWTLNAPLGKGSFGRVYLASNSKNEVVAVKFMQRNSNPGSARAIENEISTCQRLTAALAQELGNSGRVVQLKEMFDLGLVLEPMTPLTLDKLIGNRTMGGPRGMTIEAATILREALLGLQFLHENGWIHQDIKPRHIGVIPSNPPRAVILDVGQAEVLVPGTTLQAAPGQGGTMGYLAPEREMSCYDKGVDIWPMGVIATELTYGRHPFMFAKNPWRPGAEHEEMRPAFHRRYQEAVNKLSKDYKQYMSQKTIQGNLSFVHLGDMIVQMLRHEWAWDLRDRARRINVSEALRHPAWEPLLSDSQQSKRVRLEESER